VHLRIRFLRAQQKHQGKHVDTEDTIRIKMFPTDCLCIRVSVYLLKKSQPYSQREFSANNLWMNHGFDQQGTGIWSVFDDHTVFWDHGQFSKTFKTHSSGLPEWLFSSGYSQLQSFITFLMPYYDDTVNWAYMAISKDKELAKLDDGKSIVSEDGSALVYISDNKISLDVPITHTNLVSFFQGIRLRYNDGQRTRDIVTFLGADLWWYSTAVQDTKIWWLGHSCQFRDIELHWELRYKINSTDFGRLHSRKKAHHTFAVGTHFASKGTFTIARKMMSHHTGLYHLPFPKLIAMAEAGEISRHLASLKGRCPICVACLFGTAHKCPWHSKSKKVILFERSQTITPVPKPPWITLFRHNQD
jgi:hypothetical protein